MSNNINREIEELKKKLKELENASLNAVKNLSEEEKENIIPKEEREELINKGVDFDGEIRKTKEVEETPSKEEPKKKKGELGLLGIVVLIIIGTIIGLTLRESLSQGVTETGYKQKDYSYQTDEERGFGIVDGIRGWFDEEKYQKNQPNKDRCYHYSIYGVKLYFCDATEQEIKKAREDGTEDHYPDMPLKTILKMYQVDNDHAEPSGEVSEDQLMTMSDELRGFYILNGYRVWTDMDKYEKYQIHKEEYCVPYVWDYSKGIVCYPSEKEIKYAKEKGTYRTGLVTLGMFFEKFEKPLDGKGGVNASFTPEMRKIRRKRVDELF